MSEEDGLLCAYVLNGSGGGRQVGWDAVRSWQPAQGPLWVHLDRSSPGVRRWLEDESEIDPLVSEALLAEDARPRTAAIGGGVLVILRGVNLNPGADPEDMVSIRLWLDGQRVITARRQHLMAVSDLRDSLAGDEGPLTPADLVIHLSERLIARMGPVLSELDDEVDELEDQILAGESGEVRARLSDARRTVIRLRRHLAPERQVLARLESEHLSWFDERQRMRLHEVADRITRYVEDLDASRDRATVTQEELVNRLTEQMNRRMYVLSIVTAIFLPLSLFTGLLGINLGGIPGQTNPWAFEIFIVFLMGVAGLLILFFRWRRLL